MINLQLTIVFVFGVTFVALLVILAIKFPDPTPFQYTVFRTVLSLATAGAAAMIPGFIDIQVSAATKLLLRAGGALAVFVIIYFINPARLAMREDTHETTEGMVPPETPNRLPNGAPFPTDKRDAFFQVWQSLVALEHAGRDLWRRVSDQTLSAFADRWREAEVCIGDNALFFSEDDYSALQELMRAADFYLRGKTNLSNIRNGTVYSKDYEAALKLAGRGERNRFVDDAVRRQITQNKRWLTRYKRQLSSIRSSLHESVAS